MLGGLLLALPAAAAAFHAGPATVPGAGPVEWHAPFAWVRGEAFPVRVVVPGGGVPAWMLSPAAFRVDGEPLAPRPEGEATLTLPGESVLELVLDLGPALAPDGDFRLTYDLAGEYDPPRTVRAFERAPEGLEFLSMEPAELGRYLVLLRTNRGDLLVELWPADAPNHVRNFLDLAATGFYDGILFHRVIPGFMIQAGDPRTKDPDCDPREWGGGLGPRTLEAEFNARHHERGTVSMARSNDPDSATSQFFVLQNDAPQLDGQYTAFGRLADGHVALDRIARTPTAKEQVGQGMWKALERPAEPQRIEHAWVVLPLSPSAPNTDR